MKECYAVKPAEVEVFPLDGASDIILRKNIQEVPDEVPGEEGGTRWECDERQMRVASAVFLSAVEVKSNFARYWAMAGGEAFLDDVKEAKLQELSEACRTAIIAGFDVTLSDGKNHHFSMTVEDQLNINALYGLLAGGAEEVPYHADGEPCVYFSRADFLKIVESATAHKTYHESYYNSLKAYVASKRTEATVVAISYGTEIPEQYQSSVLRTLLAV